MNLEIFLLAASERPYGRKWANVVFRIPCELETGGAGEPRTSLRNKENSTNKPTRVDRTR
jgi:hypothetical protein